MTEASSAAPPPAPRRRRVWTLFLLVLLSCAGATALIYETLRQADDDLTLAILGAAQDEARLIASSLTPLLMRDDARAVGAIDAAAREMAGHGRTLRVIRNARQDRNDPTFLVAAHPSVNDGDFAAIRAKLDAGAAAGLDRTRCTGSTRLAERLEAPRGTPEILAAATLVPAGGHCWTVLVGWTAAPLIASSIGRPYWQTPEIRRAAVILGGLIALVLGVLLLLWRRLRIAQRPPLAATARYEPDFTAQAETKPSALDATTALREAAEASLHAARAPLAALACSLEPLRESLRMSDTPSLASLDVAKRAVERLQRLLDGGDALDRYSADLVDPRRDIIDLRKRVADVVFDYHAEGTSRGLSLSYEALHAAPIRGTARLIDSVVTTLIDDALQASQAGDVLRIVVRIGADPGEACLVIEAPDHRTAPDDPALPFDRTTTPSNADKTKPTRPPLWLAARQMEAMGGRLVAVRGADKLLSVAAHWPLANATPADGEAAAHRPATELKAD